MDLLFAALILGVPFFLIWWYFGLGADEAKREYSTLLRMDGDPKIVCPQCHQAGRVTTKKVMEKAGIDGAKATAAVLTGGVSVLATGLSASNERTEARCANCNSVWRY